MVETRGKNIHEKQPRGEQKRFSSTVKMVGVCFVLNTPENKNIQYIDWLLEKVSLFKKYIEFSFLMKCLLCSQFFF